MKTSAIQTEVNKYSLNIQMKCNTMLLRLLKIKSNLFVFLLLVNIYLCLTISLSLFHSVSINHLIIRRTTTWIYSILILDEAMRYRNRSGHRVPATKYSKWRHNRISNCQKTTTTITTKMEKKISHNLSTHLSWKCDEKSKQRMDRSAI